MLEERRIGRMAGLLYGYTEGRRIRNGGVARWASRENRGALTSFFGYPTCPLRM